jgi:hypothetical protein
MLREMEIPRFIPLLPQRPVIPERGEVKHLIANSRKWYKILRSKTFAYSGFLPQNDRALWVKRGNEAARFSRI